MDSVVRPWNNRGQVYKTQRAVNFQKEKKKEMIGDLGHVENTEYTSAKWYLGRKKCSVLGLHVWFG